METVGAMRRFFACGYQGGAKRPVSVNQGQGLIRGRGVLCRNTDSGRWRPAGDAFRHG
jgi:hypothetical protein